MSRQSAAYRTTGAGSATLPMASLIPLATGALYLVEVGVTNTTVTSFECSLKRMVTSIGTPGTAQSVVYEEDSALVAKGDPRDTHTVAPTLVAGELRRATIGASFGSGAIWTFGSRGLYIPSAVTVGVALMPMVGTGQICDVYWCWDA